MSRWKKLIGALALVVVLAGVGTAVMFQNELQAVIYYLRYSPEEQEAMKQANEEKLAAALQQANVETPQADSQKEPAIEADKPKESAPVQKPQQTVQKPAVQQPPKQNDKQQEPQQPAVKEEEKKQEYDAELAAMVGEIYALRTSFVGQLDDLLEQAKAEYVALPAEEREKQKMTLAGRYINIAGGLEASCDQQMEDILSRIQAHLQETGGDLSLIDEIRQVYKDEKALKKSYYMSMLD